MVQMAIILLDADNTFDVKTERARYMINSFKQYLDELTPPLYIEAPGKLAVMYLCGRGIDFLSF